MRANRRGDSSPLALCVLAVLGAVALGWPGAASATSCTTGVAGQSTAFTSTSAEGCYVVPSGVSELQVVAVGAGGSNASFGGSGASGAEVSGDVPVTPGETIYVDVGVGGGSGVYGGGNGGGASEILTCALSASACSNAMGTPQDPRLVVAGGGGGGGYGGYDAGGGGAGYGGGGESNVCKAGAAGSTAAVGGYETSGGGGGGTCASGGGGGIGINGSSTAASGAGGTVNLGGGGAGTFNGGGGGGGGYYGGGGGAGPTSVPGDGGGGGGGSSFGPGGSTFTSVVAGTAPSVTISALTATLSLSASSLPFGGAQPQQTVSAPQSLTITNQGNAPLAISGLTFAGSDPQDFLISSNGCMGQIAAGASCTLGVSFAPQGQGSHTATLQIASNDPSSPASVGLSGTGGQLPQGPTGATGAPGTTGLVGPQGAQGPAGKIELVTCKTVSATKGRGAKRHRVRVQKCTTRLVSGPAKFTIKGGRLAATIARAGVPYATGTAVPTGAGSWQLVLRGRRTVLPGRYTLTLRSRAGSHRIVRRLRITIG